MRFSTDEPSSSDESEIAMADEVLKPINKPLDVGSFKEAKRRVGMTKESSPDRAAFTGQDER